VRGSKTRSGDAFIWKRCRRVSDVRPVCECRIIGQGAVDATNLPSYAFKHSPAPSESLTWVYEGKKVDRSGSHRSGILVVPDAAAPNHHCCFSSLLVHLNLVSQGICLTHYVAFYISNTSTSRLEADARATALNLRHDSAKKIAVNITRLDHAGSGQRFSSDGPLVGHV
jgi:hypothetical protein